MSARDPETFSSEELELAMHLERGATPRQIADHLGLSTAEVASRTALLLRRIGARSRQDLVTRIALLTAFRKSL